MAGARRTLRARLTALYAASLLVCGTVLLALAMLPALSFRHTTRPDAAGHAVSDTNLPHLLRYTAVALVVLTVLSVVLGRLLAGRALRPLRVIGTSARAISASDLHRRLRLDASYQEFSELGEALDDLFGRLDAAFEAQRRFVANAAHELRTPLTAERTLLQVALADPEATADTLRAACTQLLELGRQQEQLIEALLTLAAGENGVEDWQPIDLADVAGRVTATRLAEAGHHGIRLDAGLRSAPMRGDPRLVESLVANLVDNALRYNTPDGWVGIVTGADAGTTTITISNSGAPVPPEQVGRLVEPFQRLAGPLQRLGGRQARHPDGHGLGLAIVRTIAIAHGAALSVRARAGGGLVVTVGFPTGTGAASAGPHRS